MTREESTLEKEYAVLVKQIQVDNVEEVLLEGNKATIKFYKNPYSTDAKSKYIIYIPDISSFMDEVSEKIKQDKIKLFRAPPPPSPPWWISILPTIGLIVIFVLFWVFFLQQSQGGGGNRVMSFGKSRAKLSVDDKKKITFEDVAGADEEKEELKEIVEFL